MIQHIREIFLYELRRNARRKGFLIATFGVPLLLFASMFLINVLGSTQSTSPQEIAQTFDFEGIKKAGYVDLSGEFSTVPEKLETVLIPYPDEASARAALNAKEIDVFYVIAADYMTTGKVKQHLPGFSMSLMNSEPVKQLVYETFAADSDPALLRRLANPTSLSEINLERDTSGERDEDADFILVYIFTIVFLLGLFMTNGYLMQSVIEEKETRLIEILISSVSPFELLVGKILALGVLGILQIIGWIASLLVAWQIAMRLPAFQALSWIMNITISPSMLLWSLVYFILGYVFFAAIYAAIGAMSNSIREGPQYAAIFTLPAVVPFYMFTVFIQTPNGTLPTILSMLPITAPISMLMRLSLTEVPLLELLISVVLQILSIIVAMWVAGRLFRVQTLLAGKTPKLTEIPKLLRG